MLELQYNDKKSRLHPSSIRPEIRAETLNIIIGEKVCFKMTFSLGNEIKA